MARDGGGGGSGSSSGGGTLKFVTLDVFTRTPYAGNPLAVVLVPAGEEVADERLQTIAREFNLSETVFLYLNGDDGSSSSPDKIPEWRIRIFMTTSELPFAGHPTIGVAVYALGTLAGGASRGRFLCPAGTIDVDFDSVRVEAKASIPHNVHLHTEQPPTAAEVYDLQPALKQSGIELRSMQVASPVKGMNFLNVELPDLEALATVAVGKKPSLKLDSEWNVGFGGELFYVRTGEGEVRTRMIEGNFEDPATGSASCGLAAQLALSSASSKTNAFTITQGVEMGRQSGIGVVVTLTDDLKAVEKIELSGSAVQVMEGTLEY